MRFSRERPVKVVMLGAGGTGGHIAPHLYRLLYALERPVRFIICDGDVVEIDLDFFEYQDNGTYIRNGESFCERAYTHEELAQMLKKAGFIIAGVYGDMTEETPGETEERVFYVAVKA